MILYVIIFVLSRISDIITFSVFPNIIFSCVSIMLLYSVCVIFYCFVPGSEKTTYAQLFSLITLFAAAVLANLKTVKQIIHGIAASSQDISFIWNVFDFIKGKSWILLIIAKSYHFRTVIQLSRYMRENIPQGVTYKTPIFVGFFKTFLFSFKLHNKKAVT